MNKVEGSPLVILKHLSYFKNEILSKQLKVTVYFNDNEKKKINTLKQNISGLNLDLKFLKIIFESKDFSEAFNEQYERINSSKSANLVLLDQSGIKHIKREVFHKLNITKQTDFIFFISSSYFSRFKNDPHFMNYLNIDINDINNEQYYNIHRVIFKYYKSFIPYNIKYYLAPFSIKKGSHIYGLIFGTNHTLGIEKFLKICWKLDGERGEANFNIDSENLSKTQYNLFKEFDKPRKREVFEKTIIDKIAKNQLKTDFDVYEYSLLNGFQLKDAKNLLQDLIIKKKISSEISLISNNLHKINKSNLN